MADYSEWDERDLALEVARMRKEAETGPDRDAAEAKLREFARSAQAAFTQPALRKPRGGTGQDTPPATAAARPQSTKAGAVPAVVTAAARTFSRWSPGDLMYVRRGPKQMIVRVTSIDGGVIEAAGSTSGTPVTIRAADVAAKRVIIYSHPEILPGVRAGAVCSDRSGDRWKIVSIVDGFAELEGLDGARSGWNFATLLVPTGEAVPA